MHFILLHMSIRRRWCQIYFRSIIISTMVRTLCNEIAYDSIVKGFGCWLVLSAVTATLIHDAISNPTEVIKQRLQMYNSPYRTIVQCATGVYKNEGFKAFYRSYVTQLCMNVPHQALHFSTYEFFQNKVNVAHFMIENLFSIARAFF